MQLNSKQELVLAALLRKQRELAALDFTAADGLPAVQRGQYRLAIVRAREGAVPIDLAALLGYIPTASQRVMFHREFDRLEILGLVRRVNFYGGRRASHLRLTEMGEREAARLLAEDDVGTRAMTSPPGPAARRVDKPADVPEPIDLNSIDWSVLVIPDDAQTTEANDAAQQPA